MNIIFCGSNLPDAFEGKLKYLSAAGNQFQNNLVRALRKKHNVKVFTYINYSLSIEKESIEEECEKEDYNVFFCAETPIKACKQFRKAVLEEMERADIIIAYNVLYAWLGFGSMMKKKGKKSVLIVADYTGRSEQKNMIRKILADIIKREFNYYTKTVILSPGIKRYLKSDCNSLLINGCIRWENFEKIGPAEIQNGLINIVYTGGFSYVVGTDLMIEAFKKIDDPNIRLILCGQGGDLKDRARKANKEDSRISYKGFLSRPEYYCMLEKANILINPRNMNYEQNLSNFPSKVLEYIAAGRYIVSTKFVGWEKYKSNIMFCGSSVESIQKKLKEAISFVRKDPSYYYEQNRILAVKMDWNNNVDRFLS